MKRALSRPIASVLTLGLLSAGTAFGGGQLNVFDFTDLPNLPPGPLEGTVMVETVSIQWDPRCVPVSYRFNTAVLPSSAEPPLDVAAARQVFDDAFDAWNAIPTSFIHMEIVGEVSRPKTGPFDLTVFDFVNEVNFLADASDGLIAFSPSVSLTADTTFTAGQDVDGDGDSDIFDPAVEGRETCADLDDDGDIEFPAGFYPAGTMIDNDVVFNNETITWTTGAPDSIFGNLDLQAVATHEFGHSHGLSHTAINQLGADDGTTPTMINGVSSGDGAGELALRSLSSDDIAWSSFVYPEGSQPEGAGALQPGDIAFDHAYGVITGEMTQGELDLPLVGASAFAVDFWTGDTVSSHVTGTARAVWNGAFLDLLEEFPSFHFANGTYTLPVPHGWYKVGVEALDGQPTFSGAINNTTIIGGFFGLQTFDEEFILSERPRIFQWPRLLEVRPGELEDGVDHVTSVNTRLDGFDTVGFNPFTDVDGFFASDAPPGRLYAVAIPVEEVEALLDSGLEPKGAAFRSFLAEASVPARFASARLVTGTIDVDGTVDLDLHRPLAERRPFIGQDNDYSPLFFQWPAFLAWRIEREIRFGATHLFLVLELEDSFPGELGFAPFVGFDIGQEAGLLGRSYLSDDDGVTFTQIPGLNFMFRMIFGDPRTSSHLDGPAAGL